MLVLITNKVLLLPFCFLVLLLGRGAWHFNGVCGKCSLATAYVRSKG